MKIISLAVSNIMKVTAALIQPKSDVVVIQGENEAGKSSLLNSIVMAFSGDRALPEMPLRRGQKKGEIVVKLDGDKALGIPPFVITRSVTDKKAYVKIEPESVTAGETPRSFLDKLIGSISFDPLKFINEDSKKQKDTLLRLIGIDPDEWATKEKIAFDKRTELGRQLKIAEAKVKDAVIHEGVGSEEVKVGELTDKLQKALKDNQEIINRKEANNRLKADALEIKETKIPTVRNEIFDLETKLAAKKEELQELENSLAMKREQHKAEKDDLALTFPTDTAEIEAEIANIESTNAKIRHNNKVTEDVRDKDTKKFLYEQADNDVGCVRAQRLKLIQEATMPIPGLAIDDDGILYNSIPLDQCSDGAKLMIGVAISMALNPTMRVIQIKDGSLLDKKNMELLRKVVKDKDFQLWVEKVNDIDGYDASGKIGIFVSEGEIQYVDGVKVEKECAPKVEKKSKSESTKVITDPKVDEEW